MSENSRNQPGKLFREPPPRAPARVAPVQCRDDLFQANLALSGHSTGERITRAGFGTAATAGNYYSSHADSNEAREMWQLADDDILAMAGFTHRGRELAVMVLCAMAGLSLLPLVL